MINRQELIQALVTQFGKNPDHLVQSPGRVNLIGEHTDYNEGFVMPIAIDRELQIAFRARDDSRIRIHSMDFNQTEEFDLNFLDKRGGWIEYIKGVARELKNAGHDLVGWEGVITGNIPIGAGLSSSAALELAAAKVFSCVSKFAWDPGQMAVICQRAENLWVGVHCGIMDQMVSAAGKAGHALFIDCRSLDIEHVPIPGFISIVVLDTSTRRDLTSSAYNERRMQCERAAHMIGVKALRDVHISEMETCLAKLERVLAKRAKHVITENYRVVQVKDALQAGDLDKTRKLIHQSHESLRDDFEVSSKPLNLIVDAAVQQVGCYGARMTGAGFGGCAIALVDQAYIADFTENVTEIYKRETSLVAKVYVCQPSQGTRLSEISN